MGETTEKAEILRSPKILDIADISRDAFNPVDLGRSSGFFSLDIVLGGIRRGEMTVISANTGVGKTTFSLNILYNISRQGRAVWINSYEMHPNTIFRKIASQVLGKPCKTSQIQESDILDFYKYTLLHKIYINPECKSHDILTLKRDIEIAKNSYNVEYVLIDHLDYVAYGDNNKTSLERLDYTMQELHCIAITFNVGILLIVHPTKLPQGKSMYTMNELRGSSSIAQYADNVIILNRVDENLTKFTVCKNRLLGCCKSFTLAYDASVDAYKEVEKKNAWE